MFFVEYTWQTGSLAPVYMSLARHIQAHWPDLSWFPLWRGGMPFENTYQPLWHLLTAFAAWMGHLTPGRAYFFMAGVAYSGLAPAVYLMTRQLCGSISAAFWAGLLVSLWSPAAMLVPAIATDLGGMFNPHRLQVIMSYADLPHAAGLAMVPLAILFLDRARRFRKTSWWSATALVCGAIILTNIPAVLVLILALIAYSFAYGGWFPNLGILVTGYVVVCGWFPPSTVKTVLINTQEIEPANAFRLRHLLYLLAVVAISIVTAELLRRAGVSPGLRFLWMFALFTGGITLASYWFDITLIAQPHRFQIATDLSVGMAVAATLFSLVRSTSWARVGTYAVLLVLGAFAVVQYRKEARISIRPIDITATSQFKIANWMDQHAEGRRVWVMGSSSFWLDVFGDTPQATGCCDQGMILPISRVAAFVVGTDIATGTRAVEISLDWMVALGAHLVATSGPGSSEVYWDWKDPKKFEGKLAKVWQDGGDAIYAVPQVTRSLAHRVRPNELVLRRPQSGIDVVPLEGYVAALLDPRRTTIETAWRGSSLLAIHGYIEPGERISVQVPFHSGWQARSAGHRLKVSSDGLGFVVIEPLDGGPPDINLEFVGSADRNIGRVISITASVAAIVLLFAEKIIRTVSSETWRFLRRA